ncbi:MAG: metallophosphoesterase [Mogibacterium sp.]|nr:metallophosphoesterase [Mogibacterium sp.]
MKARKHILLIILAQLVLAGIIAGLVIHFREPAKPAKDDEQTAGAEIVLEEAEEQDSDDILASIFVASDYQYQEGWKEPADTLEGILDAVNAGDKRIDTAIFCGDYSNKHGLWDYQISPESSIEEIRDIFSAKSPKTNQDDILFIQGNHDALTESITESGLHEFSDYLVYVLNCQNDFPWSQGKTAGCLDKTERSAEKMKACFDKLIAAGEKRPIIIATHVPLHYSARTSSRHSTGDNLYSSLIFDVVNSAADSLDIIYLFGHNHSKGWDCYMGGSTVFKTIGDTILIPEFEKNSANTDIYTEEILRFTYLNAGYIGYYMNCGPSEVQNGTLESYKAADDTLTGAICEITPNEIILTRYSENGIHQISGDGEGNPYKGGIDAELIGSEFYNISKESPVHIRRKS